MWKKWNNKWNYYILWIKLDMLEGESFGPSAIKANDSYSVDTCTSKLFIWQEYEIILWTYIYVYFQNIFHVYCL